ncbi:MAG: cobalt ECF transporter T component CbiQ [Treponema sp.]|jgi:cobalt/nickel transport system permease protein|nr:cobalt ECF transporter T component CbiQ [Treponema sp.]
MGLYHGAAGIEHLERLAQGHSPIHRLHAGAKIIVTVVYTVTVISFPPENISGMAAFVLYPAVLMPLSETSWRSLLARLFAALPFAMLGGLSGLINLPETSFYAGGIAVSRGMAAFASIMLRTALSVFAVLILIATTPFTAINQQFVKFGFPKIIVLQFVMTYRYISVLIHEAASMFSAYTLRSPRARGILMRDMGSFLGQLMLRSFDRAERVYAAMKCRGFDGMYRGGIQHPFGPADFCYTAVLSAAIIALRFFNISLFLGRLTGKTG